MWYDRNNNNALNTSSGTSSSDELIAILKNVQLGSNTITSASPLPWATYA